MKIFYTDISPLPLPEGHRFPQAKYSRLREELLHQQILRPDELVPAVPATRDELLLAHTPAYVDGILTGSIDPKIIRQIGLPWSPELVKRSLASVGATLCAAREALQTGVACNLGGGTHHALADQGQGYCVFNDIAVATLLLLKEGQVQRTAIIDLDVHQGNGNAAILGPYPQVFVFSMHGQKNYPFRKVPSTLDIDLPDNTGDDAYLDQLQSALPRILSFHPDLIFYQAGVDPLAEDRLGRLDLSMLGLARRDRLVLETCRAAEIPLVLTMGGGYALPIERTVQGHVQTYRILKSIYN